MEIELHPAQAHILRELLFKPAARFSDLNVLAFENDHFTFHLKRLQALGLVEKSENGTYSLSIKGKEFANRFDTEKVKIEKQAKLGVAVIAHRTVAGEDEYLFQQRLKHPYYGYYGFITGKIDWGEQILETAQRELLEETNLSGSFKLKGIEHKMDYDPNENLLEDKFFYVVQAFNLSGELIDHFEGGRNQWFKRDEILNNQYKLFGDIENLLSIIHSPHLTFLEQTFTDEEY